MKEITKRDNKTVTCTNNKELFITSFASKTQQNANSIELAVPRVAGPPPVAYVFRMGTVRVVLYGELVAALWTGGLEELWALVEVDAPEARLAGGAGRRIAAVTWRELFEIAY